MTSGLFQRVFEEQNASINPLAKHIKMGSQGSPDLTEMLGGGAQDSSQMLETD